MRRVVVTGCGVVSPLGNDVVEFWESLRLGLSAIGPIASIGTNGVNVNIAAEVRGFDARRHFDRGTLSTLDRFAQFALVAAGEAISDAKLVIDRRNSERTATVVGSGAGGQVTQDGAYLRIYGRRKGRVHPHTIPKAMLNAAASQITMAHGITGPAFSVASACASAGHAVGVAIHMVQSGLVDRVIAGGADACITFGTLKSWEALRVMATDTCRPFSKGRKGMVLGEGAAMMVIETAEEAAERGVRPYAELVGFGMSSDAANLLHPSRDGAARAMAAALNCAGMWPEEIDYINAHGTGTAANDVTETQAIREVFGAHADNLAVSSTKSMHGHAMGAAPAIELVATLLAVRDGIAPPTVNFSEADPDCDLDYVFGGAVKMPIGAALSNAFAFGGLNAVVAVRRLDD